MPTKIVHTYALAWEAQTPEATINVERQTDAGGNISYKAYTPNVRALEPRFGEKRIDAIQSMQRSLWAYFASGNDAAKANKEK